MIRSLLVLVVTLGALSSGSVGAAPAAEVHPEWGSTTGHDARIKKGCRTYVYDYTVTPPEGYWSLETFLVGRDGKTYGSGQLITGADPTTGRSGFRLCRRSTPAGRYTIRALLTVNDDQGTQQSGWLPDSTFRLRLKRR